VTEDDYYLHHCRRCGDRLDEDHSCDATDHGVNPERVKVILPEHRGSESDHVGKSGVMTTLDRSTGRAEVEFDGGELVTIDACCLQYQGDGGLVEIDTRDDFVADPHYDPDAAWAAGDDWGPRGIARGYDSDSQ
jgi:hypothetical protein